MDLTAFNSNLEEIEGIYYSRKNSRISYPASGNEDYFKIEDSSFWFVHRNDCIITAVNKISPKQLFFDIGGGNGFVAKGLENSGIETILVEPGKSGAMNAQKRHLKNIVCSTLEDAEFKANSLPSAGMFDVVEHIEDDISFLKSIHGFLEKNGHLYLTVPAFSFLWSAEDDFAGHYRRYSAKQLEKKLKDVGFDIVYSTYIFSILPIPVFLFRTLPSRFGIKRNAEEKSQISNDHNRKEGIITTLLNKIWKWELSRIQKGKRIPFGGSCFIVAKKR